MSEVRSRRAEAGGQKPETLTEASDIRPQTPEFIKKQLSFKEKREFDLLTKEIAELGKEKETITKKLTSGKTPFEELRVISKRIGEVTRQLDEKELRWLELSEMQS